MLGSLDRSAMMVLRIKLRTGTMVNCDTLGRFVMRMRLVATQAGEMKTSTVMSHTKIPTMESLPSTTFYSPCLPFSLQLPWKDGRKICTGRERLVIINTQVIFTS